MSTSPTREQINASAAAYGFRLPTPADTSDPRIVDIGREFHATMTALRKRKITADEMRARNRALRERVGDALFEQGKNRALAVDCAMD